MTEKELKKMSRLQLLQIMYDQSAEIDKLQEKVKKLEQTLEERQTMSKETGSIAEVSSKLNGIFQETQKVTNQYIENIKMQYELTQKNCAALERQTEERCRKFLDEALTLISAYTDNKDI